jgi:hypothetical protein
MAASNIPLEQPAGSRSLVAAAHRGRDAEQDPGEHT